MKVRSKLAAIALVATAAIPLMAGPAGAASSSWSYDGTKGSGSGTVSITKSGTSSIGKVSGSFNGNGSWVGWTCSYVKVVFDLNNASDHEYKSSCSAGNVSVSHSYTASNGKFRAMRMYACARITALPDVCGSPFKTMNNPNYTG